MSDAAEDAAFSKAVDRFRAGLTREQRDQFAGCDKTEVEKAIAEIQLRHGSQRRQKNMRRVAKFIEGMSQLGQVIEVFLNVEVSVAFIWGPIKFLLQTASTWVETLDLLLDTYAEIGETLPGLSRYGELFKQHPLVGKQLENYYCDVLEFNKCALEVFSRPDSSSGVWIASEPTLKAWSDPSSTQSSFLFLSGIPGAGKTTLTSGIVNHLLNLQKKEELRGNKIMVAYFYFKHTHEDKRTLHKMVRSVLSQLIDQDSSLLDHVYKELCGTSRISLDQAKEMAQLAIRSTRLCFLVVDGLDECVKDENSRTTEAEKVINWLMELTTPAPGAQNSDIRVLVSSQRDGVIEEKLREHPTLQLESLQPHDNDIERFVRIQARVISEVFPDSEAIDEEKIVEKITTAAKGMFLYAKVVLDNLLEQETAFDFAAELQEKNFPKGLEEA
ncbi:hypothetical protein KJ359_007093 [Pestalotiopsis sp. 9143b]|nr:hypothetical protein KJ359_007093 [Pestalotiopsis sp. 9143b]